MARMAAWDSSTSASLAESRSGAQEQKLSLSRKERKKRLSGPRSGLQWRALPCPLLRTMRPGWPRTSLCEARSKRGTRGDIRKGLASAAGGLVGLPHSVKSVSLCVCVCVCKTLRPRAVSTVHEKRRGASLSSELDAQRKALSIMADTIGEVQVRTRKANKEGYRKCADVRLRVQEYALTHVWLRSLEGQIKCVLRLVFCQRASREAPALRSKIERARWPDVWILTSVHQHS